MVDTHSALASARLIERPAEYSVLLQRPRFVEVLDQREHKLRQVLSDYSFPVLVRCGLANCRTPHRDGFLVETEDGLETNVGHVCGRRTFGERFDIARSTYKKLRELQDLRDRAAVLVAQIPMIRRDVDDLYATKLGVRWIEQIRAALAQVLGTDLFESLCVTQRRGSFEVFEYRQRTRVEVDRIVEQTRQKREQVRYEQRLLGRLEPMPWIVYNFKGRLRTELVEELESFALLDVQHTEAPTLRRRVKKLDGWELIIPDAQAALTAAARFFEPENLRLLMLWVPAQQERRRQSLNAWVGSMACTQLARGEYP